MPHSTTATHALGLRGVIDTYLSRSDPHVLTAHDRLDRDVTWVHSSEIFEIGPLLAGGELLLTTGLGLAGLDAGTRRHYVRDLAERGVAALAFELGRTFDAVPEEMIREGSAVRLPIIELRRVVPFIEVCREANTALISDEVAELRVRADLDALLHTDLTAGGGVAAMLGHLAEILDAPLVLLGSDDALLAAHGVDDDRAAWRVVDDAVATQPLVVRGREVGRVVAGYPRGSATSGWGGLLQVAAGPLGAALTRSGTQRTSIGARLIADLLDRQPIRRADLVARLGSSGLPVGEGSVVVPLAAEAPDRRMAENVLRSAGAAVGAVFYSTIDATVFGLVVVGSAGGEPGGGDPVGLVRDAVTAAAQRSTRVTVVVGKACVADDLDPGPGLSAVLGDGLRACAQGLGIALRVRPTGSGQAVFAVRELAVDIAVGALPRGVVDDVRALAEPLAAHDAASSTQLVHTLDVHLRHGCSATRSAEALHIGRQSLYQRLDRIRGLLGFDPTTPQIYASMVVSLSALRADAG